MARNNHLSAKGLVSGKRLIMKYGELITATIIQALKQVHQVEVYNKIDEEFFWRCWCTKADVLQEIYEEVYRTVKVPTGCGGVSVQIQGDMLILYTD
jgi:hypothetical protein